MSDPSRLTATEAARRIAAGTLRPVELMEACLDRVAARDDVVRAFAHLDPALARRNAEAARSGKLHGLPIGVKDVFDTADMPSQYNSPIWEGHRPRADAAAVAWARAAGGVIMAKTVTTEFATREPGPTTHPMNPRHTPGGSSSGSAAGVADYFFPLAFGTQTAGSNIRPAAFCGIVGYKPTFATFPRLGMKMMSDGLDTVSVMARSVVDCALFASAVTRRDLGDPERRPARAPRIGICRSPVWHLAQPETHELLERVTQAVARAGAAVQARELPDAFTALDDAHPTVMKVEGARNMGWELLTARDRLSAVLREWMEWGLEQSPEHFESARSTLIRLQDAFPSVMEGLDILLTPSAPGEAPEGLGWTGDAAFNSYWTALHVPCVTVPAGSGPKGLPLGIQIVARRGEDRQALTWAQWVSDAVG